MKNVRRSLARLLPLLIAAMCVLTAAAQGKCGLPADGLSRGYLPLKHTAFVAGYDTATHCPAWVGWTLTAMRTTGAYDRESTFTPDPQLSGRGATHADYTRSGYDRGHMCPAADNSWSETAMRESFYTSNICPQTPSLNRGSWKRLEDGMRRLAAGGDTLYVVCGPIFEKGKTHTAIGKTAVSVPERFFKVVLVCNKGKYRAAGFIFENTKEKGSRPTVVPVDSVEALTGLDFYPNVPAATQKRVEAKADATLRRLCGK